MERARFVAEYEKGCWSMVELCAAFRISRKTGYKILARFRAEGLSGLEDRTRAPVEQPLKTSRALEREILEVRSQFPTWGGKKIRAWLERFSPETGWPSRTTVDAILKRAGVVRQRKRRRRCTPSGDPLIEAAGPNQVWCADYKGWFRLGNGERCDPLTVSDAYSRYLLVCDPLFSPKLEDVRGVFERAFREYGLPDVIRTDNGPPFGSTGLGGLTRLSVWLLRLAILPQRIEPGKPQQNGRHERMHLTLKQEIASPPKASRLAQQRACGSFRRTYNNERPHEAIEMCTPADLYTASPRPMPKRLPAVEYPKDYQRRRVRENGSFKWRGHAVSASMTLDGEDVGLVEVGDAIWNVFFGKLLLGQFHEKSMSIVPARHHAAQRTGG